MVAMVVAGCATATPSPVGSPSSASGSGSSDAPTSSATLIPSSTPLISVPPTGRPYAADQVLAAMRDSRRPGGVPDQLETTDVAGAIADAVWTYDGRPYPVLVISGSCGAASCTVEVSGAPTGAAGADLYLFAVTPGSGAVELQATDLHGYPGGLDALLDEVARGDGAPCSLGGLALSSATWRIPPDAGQFWVHFRSGGEEGSPGVDVLVDLLAGSAVQCAAP